MTDTPYPWRLQAPIYGVGFFAVAIYYTSMVLVPLQAVALGAPPFMLGVIFAARHFLPLLLSIHAGALMDRLGTARVVMAVAALGIAIPLFYPMSPWFGMLIACQLFAGLTDIMGWMGAQTLIGQHLGGRTVYSGRLMAVGKGGPLIGPVLAGGAWDLWGAWGGFGVLSVLAAGMLVSAFLASRTDYGTEADDGRTDLRGPVTLRALLPRPADYGAAFRLVGHPTVALVVILGAVYHLVGAIQGTFYLSWMDQLGFSATQIGAVVSLGAAAGGIGALLTAPMCRYVPGPWLLLLASWAAVAFICVTPLFGGLFLLGVFMALRMGALGVSQPLTVSLLMHTVGPHERGLSVGLRGTLNRVASISAPVLMGLIAEFAGLEAAFYIVGALMSVGFVAMILYFRRYPEALPPLWAAHERRPRREPVPGLVRFGAETRPRKGHGPGHDHGGGLAASG